jgi:Siphovirus Gp157
MNAPSAYQLEKIVSLAQQTVESLRTEHGLVLDDDESLLAALAEENVPVERIITLLVRAALDSKAMGVAADARLFDLRQRRKRFQRAEAAYRKTVQDVLESLGLTKFSDPEFTLSLGAGQSKVIVTEIDPWRLPDEWVTVETTRTPDKARIKTALEARRAEINAALERGAGVPPELEGAILSNGSAVLTVRTK